MDRKAEDMKGRLKEATGDLTDDDDLKREGKADRASAKAKSAVDRAADKVTDVIDDVKDRTRDRD